MKQIITLNITPEEYYEIFLENMIQDYTSSTGKSINKENIKTGLKWEKNVSRNKKSTNIARVKIVEVVPLKSYTLKYMSDTRDLLTKYIVEKMDNQKIQLTIIQKGKKTEMKGFKMIEVIDDHEDEIPLTFSEKRQYKKLEKMISKKR